MLRAPLGTLRPNRDATGPLAAQSRRAESRVAMVIPGDTAVEFVIVDGLSNFLNIFNALISVRVLLSWFPQAQGIAALRPVFQLTDPYLNLFRGLIPPIGGLDLSVLPAFFLLNFAQSATPALSATPPRSLKERFESTREQLAVRAAHWAK